MLAEVLYRQGRYQESAEFARVCRELASPDDVTSQFLWRCVQAKLLARDHRTRGRTRSSPRQWHWSPVRTGWTGRATVSWISPSCRLGSRIADAFEALAQAAVRFAAQGNIVSAHWADELADDLPATLSRTVQDPLQAAVPGCAGW